MTEHDKVSRRDTLVAVAGLASGVAAASAHATEPGLGKTFVLAHGSWHGGWCWARVADRLRGQGHRVFTPSYTGMGDRAHLLRKDIIGNGRPRTYIRCNQPENPVLDGRERW